MNVSSRPKSVRSGDSTELNKDIAEHEEARERALDETLAETFPASDPLSSDPAPEPADENPQDDKIAS
jgi:hypothetical protein